MFNSKTFEAHKIGIRENMEQNLIWDKYHGTLKHKSSIETNVKSLSIMFDEEHKAYLGKMQFITKLLTQGVKVEMDEISETPYCTKRMVGVRYSYPVRSLREEISDRQVTTAMRRFIHSKINKDAGKRIDNIDCKVMDLFKAGKIDWTTVVESHSVNCSL